MKTIWSDQTVMFVKVMTIVTFFILLFSTIFYLGVKSLSEPREISYSSYLPSSAIDVNEITRYIQSPPDEEYRYFLKAKIKEEDFKDFIEELELEYANVKGDCNASCFNPPKWWNLSYLSFSYAKFYSDCRVLADYQNDYLYLYVEQN